LRVTADVEVNVCRNERKRIRKTAASNQTTAVKQAILRASQNVRHKSANRDKFVALIQRRAKRDLLTGLSRAGVAGRPHAERPVRLRE